MNSPPNSAQAALTSTIPAAACNQRQQLSDQSESEMLPHPGAQPRHNHAA